MTDKKKFEKWKIQYIHIGTTWKITVKTKTLIINQATVTPVKYLLNIYLL